MCEDVRVKRVEPIRMVCSGRRVEKSTRSVKAKWMDRMGWRVHCGLVFVPVPVPIEAWGARGKLGLGMKGLISEAILENFHRGFSSRIFSKERSVECGMSVCEQANTVVASATVCAAFWSESREGWRRLSGDGQT